MAYPETNSARLWRTAGLLCAVILLLAASFQAAMAQTETSYPVQSEPNPLVDGKSRVGLTSDPLSEAQVQDFTYLDIREENIAAPTTATYNFSSGAGSNKFAKTNNDVDEPSAPYTTTHFDGSPPEGVWTEVTYADIQSMNQVWQTANGTSGDYAALQYKLTINESASAISNIDITQTVYIQTAATTLGVWVWNFNTSAWVQVGADYSVSSTASPGENFTRSITSGFSDYLNASNLMYVIVVANTANKNYYLDYVKFVVTYVPFDYRLNWEHKVTGIGAHESYRVKIYGYSDVGETFSIKVWNGSDWVDNGYNLPSGAGAWVDYQIPASWVIGGAVSIKYDDDTDGDTTSDNIHIDYSAVVGTTAPSFDFSVDASPASLTITEGDETTSTITATLVSGSTQTVLLTGSWVGTTPDGVTRSFTPSSGTPTFSSSLQFSTTASASVGTFVYRVTADNGSLARTKDVTLTINQVGAFNYSVAASNGSLSLKRDNSATSTITVEYLSGPAASVSLSGAWVGTSPTGVGATFSPESGTPAIGAPVTSTLTFTASSTASGGAFTYRATGTSGSTTRTCDITVTLPPAAPSLSSPGNGTAIDTLTPTFDWEDATGATQYTLQLATDNNFSIIILTKSPLESTATLDESEELSYATNYYWRVRGSNAAGSGSWSQNWTFIAKQAAPKVASVTVAGGASYTSSAGVQLTLNAQNSAEMSFSGDGVVWDNWESYQASKTYTVSGPDGQKNIYIRVRDNAGDISQTFLAQVTLDQTPPATTTEASGDLGADGYKNSVLVTLTPSDVLSGVSSTTYRVDGGEWKTGDTFVISASGQHTVEYYSTDLAGNAEAAKSFDVTVYIPALPLDVLNYWWVILAVIVGVGIGWVFVIPKVRASNRLQKIANEKREIVGLIKETETKYYKEGSISRDVFQDTIRGYERRAAELEKESRVLKAKVKKKAEVKKPRKRR